MLCSLLCITSKRLAFSVMNSLRESTTTAAIVAIDDYFVFFVFFCG